MLNVTSASFKQDVLDSDIPVIVDFWAAWCGPCRMIAPIFETLSKEYEGKVKFVKLDVDSNSDIAEKYSIISIPNFTIFKNGEVHSNAIGAMSVSSLKEFIGKCL